MPPARLPSHRAALLAGLAVAGVVASVPALAAGSADGDALAAAAPGERRNWFDDPFLPATDGLAGCPAPEGPVVTAAEARAQSHWRVERGTSCWRDGICRLPNAYLYDREIAPRVVRALKAAGAFEDTSVWIVVQRRWVWLQGCVARAEQADALERLVRRIDDVEQVVPQLRVGRPATPGDVPYAAAR